MSEQTSTNEHSGACGSKKCTSLMWWATLLVAVIAVPAFGFIIASVIPAKGIGVLHLPWHEADADAEHEPKAWR